MIDEKDLDKLTKGDCIVDDASGRVFSITAIETIGGVKTWYMQAINNPDVKSFFTQDHLQYISRQPAKGVATITQEDIADTETIAEETESTEKSEAIKELDDILVKAHRKTSQKGKAK